MVYYAGIDIGSTAIKVAVIDEAGELAGHRISATGSFFYKHARETLEALLDDLGIEERALRYTVGTAGSSTKRRTRISARLPPTPPERGPLPGGRRFIPSSISGDRTPRRSPSTARGMSSISR